MLCYCGYCEPHAMPSCEPDYDETSWSWPGIGEMPLFRTGPLAEEWYSKRLYDGELWAILKMMSWRVEDRVLTDIGYRANQWDFAMKNIWQNYLFVYMDDDMTADELDRARREKRRLADALWAYIKADYDTHLEWRRRFSDDCLLELKSGPKPLKAPKPTFAPNPDAW
jgi:hypothetical protein